MLPPQAVATTSREPGSPETPKRIGSKHARPPWNPPGSCSPSFNRYALRMPSMDGQSRVRRISMGLSPQRATRSQGRWRLPVEVLELVLDFAHDDRPTLGRLGLTCRALLVGSRFHLFETLVTAPRRDSTAQRISLRALLASRYCTFKPFVKRLRFKKLEDVPTVSSLATLFPYLDDLTEVRTLIFPLMDVTSEHLKSAGWQALVRSRLVTRITKLILVRAFTMTFDEFAGVVALFPGVRELVCDQLEIDETDAALPVPPPALRTVQLGDHILTTPDHGKAKAFLRWLALREREAPLTLTIHADIEDVEFLQDYTSAAPAALQRVKVHLHDARAAPPPDLLGEIILSSNYLAGFSTLTNLTAVDVGLGALWFQKLRGQLTFHPAILYMPRVLRALPPNLERLSLDVFSRREMEHPFSVKDMEFDRTWAAIDTILAGGHFRRLRHVQFAIFVDEYDFKLKNDALEAFCVAVCGKLPGFVARGTLSFIRRQWDSYNDVNWLIRD
ncbi:hypothetical protein EV121DRAFT_263094 [Schizophyllum commune]